MALFSLLQLGLNCCIAEEQDSFLSSLTSNGATESEARAALEAVTLFPAAFQELTEAEWNADSPDIALVFLPVITSYLLAEDDVIPAWEGSVLIGALDDAYLTLRAAIHAAKLGGIDGFEKYQEPLDAISKVLPDDVRQRLDGGFDDALARARKRIETDQ